jgi:hypothetical protein
MNNENVILISLPRIEYQKKFVIFAYMSDVVVDWESTIHKNVRSKDVETLGKWTPFLEILS